VKHGVDLTVYITIPLLSSW